MGFSLVDEGRENPKYHYKRAIFSPPAKHHLNDGPTLNSGLESF